MVNENEMKIEQGDIVVLKSPPDFKMTAGDIVGTEITCYWYSRLSDGVVSLRISPYALDLVKKKA